MYAWAEFFGEGIKIWAQMIVNGPKLPRLGPIIAIFWAHGRGIPNPFVIWAQII